MSEIERYRFGLQGSHVVRGAVGLEEVSPGQRPPACPAADVTDRHRRLAWAGAAAATAVLLAGTGCAGTPATVTRECVDGRSPLAVRAWIDESRLDEAEQDLIAEVRDLGRLFLPGTRVRANQERAAAARKQASREAQIDARQAVKRLVFEALVEQVYGDSTLRGLEGGPR